MSKHIRIGAAVAVVVLVLLFLPVSRPYRVTIKEPVSPEVWRQALAALGDDPGPPREGEVELYGYHQEKGTAWPWWRTPCGVSWTFNSWEFQDADGTVERHRFYCDVTRISAPLDVSQVLGHKHISRNDDDVEFTQ